MAKGAVVEVGSKGDHDPQRRIGFANGVRQAVQEPRALVGVVDQGEQLLELIDHEQQLRVICAEDATHTIEHLAGDPRLSGGASLVASGDAEQGALQLLEGFGPGHHRGHEPVGRPRDTPGPQPRQQTGANDGRLAGPRRSDHGKETSADTVAGEPME